MNARNLAAYLLEDVYSKSTTQINLPPDMANFIQLWGELNIPDSVLYTSEDGHGREKEPHITVKYGITISEPTPGLRKLIQGTQSFKIELAEVSIFSNEKYDVVKLGVLSPELHKLNAAIKEIVPTEDTFPVYNPHCTIAYVRAGEGQQFAGLNPFGEAGGYDPTFTAEEVLFKGAGDSEDPNRVVEPIALARAYPEVAPPGKAYRVVWADGRNEQYFKNHSLARDFSDRKENHAEPPRLVDRPSGEVAFAEGRHPFDNLPFPQDAQHLRRFRSRKKGGSSKRVIL